MKSLEIYFRLIDQVTGPAKKVERAIHRIDLATRMVKKTTPMAYRVLRKELGLSERHAKTLAVALQGVAYARSGVASLTGRFLDLASGVSAAARAVFNLKNLLVAAVAGWAVSGVGRSIVDAMTFKESQLAALRLRLGPEGAAKFFERAMRVSDFTPYDPTTVIDAYKQLLTANLRPQEVETVFQAISDLVATSGRSYTGVMPRALAAIRQILDKPALQKEELMQLAESVNLGLGDFYRVLAKRLEKLTGRAWNAQAVEKAISAGKISGRLGVAAILDYVQQVVNQGQGLGTATRAQSKTIGGLLSTLYGFPKRWFMALVPGTQKEEQELFKRFAGYRAFKGFLENLTKTFNPTSALGRRVLERVRAFFNKIFKKVFGALGGNLSPDAFAAKVGELIDRAEGVLSRAATAFRVAWRYAKRFGQGVADAFALVKRAWEAIQPFADWLKRVADRFLGVKDAGEGVAGKVARLTGLIAGLSFAWRALNLVTLGGAGALARWAGIAAAYVLPNLWRMIAGLLRLGAAWLIGLGPVGWVILAVTAIGGAIAWAWNRFEWFRDGVKNVFEAVKKAAVGLVEWFKGLPERIFRALVALKDKLREAIVDAIRAIPGGDLILKALDKVSAGARWVGEKVHRGFTTGLDTLGRWYRTGAQLVNRVIAGAQGGLKVHSPSRVFEYLGRMTALGYQRGLEGLKAATLAATVPAVTLAGPAVAGAAQAQPPTQVVVHVHEGAIRVETSGGDAQAIAQAIREELVRLAMEAGHV